MTTDFEKYLQSLIDPSKTPGMNTNSSTTVLKAKLEGVKALQQKVIDKRQLEEAIKKRMEMKPTLVKRASFAEKLRGGKDTYRQTPQVVGMSGTDPVGEFVVAGATLNPIFKLAGDGLLYGAAKYLKGSNYQNWARAKLLNRELRNPLIPYSNNPIIIKGASSIREDRPKFWDGERFYTPEEEFHRRLKRIPDDIIDEKELIIEPYSNLALASNTANFTPIVKANVGKFSKLYADETINRLKGWGYDTDELLPIEVLGWRVLDRPSTYIKENVEKPVYLGIYNKKDNTLGTFDPSTGVAFADPTLSKNLPSTMFHERNMHGTDNILEALAETQGAHGIDNYLSFVDKLFFKKVKDPLQPDVDLIIVLPGVRFEISPEGNSQYFVNFGENVGELPIPEGTIEWYEGRSTINELKRKYLYNIWKDANKPETLEKVRPLYLEKIDNLQENELLEDLSKTNGYGLTYVALRKNNPQFIPDLKNLLKYGAGISIPITLNKLLKSPLLLLKQGGKLNFLKDIKDENNL